MGYLIVSCLQFLKSTMMSTTCCEHSLGAEDLFSQNPWFSEYFLKSALLRYNLQRANWVRLKCLANKYSWNHHHEQTDHSQWFRGGPVCSPLLSHPQPQTTMDLSVVVIHRVLEWHIRESQSVYPFVSDFFDLECF